jgi:hypothetical protein
MSTTRTVTPIGGTPYFERGLLAIGVPFDPEMATVFERFDVISAE